MSRSLPAVAIALFFASACHDTRHPRRPDSVPESAIWVGGPDGGTWIDCEPKAKEPKVAHYCRLYSDFNGRLVGEGLFVLEYRTAEGREISGNPLDAERITRFSAYDGTNIYVSDRETLLPSGWIDYPIGDGHGKRSFYVLGDEREEESY